MITIPVNNRGRTVIGRLGENEHRCIAFRESAAVLEMYPSAVVAVLHQRPGDPEAYPVSGQYVAIEDGVVKWTIQSGDLNATGRGQCELVFSQGGIVAKTMIYQTEILPALDGAGTPPEPWEGWVTEVAEDAAEARAWANGTKQDGSPVDPDASQYENNAKYYSEQAAASAGQITDMTAQASTLTPGSSATASFANGVLTLGIPAGANGTNGTNGQDGQDGQDGADGYSPTASVSKSGKVSTITITDKNGTTTAQVVDGTEDVETVSGSTPSITGVANTRYMCGEVASISINPPQSGIIDVVFTSGTTPAALTVPNTVKWPGWFDPTSLDASCTYELNIMDGVYGAVTAWT